MLVRRGGVERAGGERQVERQCVIVFAGNLGKDGVKLDEIGLVGFQKGVQFSDGAMHLLLDGFVMIEVLETDGKFHKRTCR